MRKRIFVKNLPFGAVDEHVRALFGQFGTVETVDLRTDRQQERPQGFVEMSSGADEAIGALHAKQLNGCRLDVIGFQPPAEHPVSDLARNGDPATYLRGTGPQPRREVVFEPAGPADRVAKSVGFAEPYPGEHLLRLPRNRPRNRPRNQPRDRPQSRLTDRLPDGGIETAIVYCEGHFGSADGKTANGLVRHSQRYEILSVIDSRKAGLDAGEVLGEKPNGIPICRDLDDALAHAGALPDYFVFGMAPASGRLSADERVIVIEAMGRGLSLVNGLHELLNDDPEMVAESLAAGVRILDVRKPRDQADLRTFSGRIFDVTCPRIAVLGTDCAIGKRTTATILTQALRDRGLEAVLVGTGQTGLIQGALYGVALDAVPSQFCSGEMEAAVVAAFEGENPDVIIIEGQGALSHPAYSTSSFILRGSCPHAVILQHAPGRPHRCDFEQMAMPTAASEIRLVEAFADTKVIGLTINHENLSEVELDAAMIAYQRELGIPVTDALTRPPEHLVEMVSSAFPRLVPSPLLAAE